MLKAKKVCLVLAAVMLWSCTLWTGMAEETVKVTINGQVLNFNDQNPVVVNERTLVPMRAIFERLGAQIDWQDATQTVTAKASSTTIQLKIGSDTALKNGASMKLDVPAQMINDRTMVPLRFVGEALGANVKWVESTGTVEITTAQAAPVQTPAPSAKPTPTPAAGSPAATPSPSAVTAKAPVAALTGQKLVINSVTACDSTQPQNPAKNAIDGDLDTRWAGKDKVWAVYDLGEAKTITGVAINWYINKQRKYNYSVEVSNDGTSWTSVIEPTVSPGKSSGAEKFAITEVSARYVRYSGDGCTEGGGKLNAYTSLVEFEVYGK